MSEDRVMPHVPHWNGVGKYSPCLSFDNGSLTIYGGGFGKQDGDGYFCFSWREMEIESDEDGHEFVTVSMDNSDLLFLRDQLNLLFPPQAAEQQP